jgi:hypothetical protein
MTLARRVAFPRASLFHSSMASLAAPKFLRANAIPDSRLKLRETRLRTELDWTIMPREVSMGLAYQAGSACAGPGTDETVDRVALEQALTEFIAENRDRCLWFLTPDFQPSDPQSAVRALDYIERYGDTAAFKRSRELRACLRQLSSDTSAD